MTGLMGITIEAPSLGQFGIGGNYTEAVVKTLFSLTSQTAWAEICNLPVRDNEISVRHEGLGKTIFTNQSGPALIWQATFPGFYQRLLVNGHEVKAEAGKEPLDHATSWFQVPVGAGDTVTVRVR